eukprot:3181107-Rhodomonas_salina.1
MGWKDRSRQGVQDRRGLRMDGKGATKERRREEEREEIGCFQRSLLALVLDVANSNARQHIPWSFSSTVGIDFSISTPLTSSW